MKWLYNLKVWQKLILLGFLFAIPFGAVVAYDILFVKAPRVWAAPGTKSPPWVSRCAC